MGKHETGFERVDRDLYPTPAWAVEALAEHVDITGKVIWECATGTGQMAEALKAAGAARVYCTDIVRRDYPLDGLFDFTSAGKPRNLPSIDLIVTNPTYGQGNRLAVKFIESGLRRITNRGTLALLLPIDFDSAKTRSHLFRDCPHFDREAAGAQRRERVETDTATERNQDMTSDRPRVGAGIPKPAQHKRRFHYVDQCLLRHEHRPRLQRVGTIRNHGGCSGW
jgi:hypothetical protein